MARKRAAGELRINFLALPCRRARIRLTVQAGKPMTVQGDGAGGVGNDTASPFLCPLDMFLVRRAADVAKLKDVPRPYAFSVITSRKGVTRRGKRSGATRKARLTA
jgi:hypothetical protein